MINWLRLTGYAIGLLVLITLAAGGIVTWQWRERPSLADLDWPVAESESLDGSAVTVTWLGISTLLFDDGETQILTDGTITRVPIIDLLTARPLTSDIGQINFALERYRMNRIAAIIPTHSHFDHAMDAGHIANRSAAVILGSESTANIARGAGVPVDQYQILANGESRHFGEFTITLIEVRHAPIGPGEDGWFSGVIEEPLVQPARFFQWKSGAVYSVIISHPRGTAVVNSSAGFVEGALHEHEADVVLLGVGGLSGLGPEYTARYWRETVRASGADRVFAIHFDDYTLPFGEIQLFPRIADDVSLAADWIETEAAADGLKVRRLPFGVPVILY